MTGKIMKIGKRTIKTFIAVLITLGIYLRLYARTCACGIFDTPAELSAREDLWYAPTNFYTPFFAGIAAVYAMHRDIASSRQQARIRSVGTIVGGYYGFIVVQIIEWIFLDATGMKSGSLPYDAILYSAVSAGIILLIVITVKLKVTSATFVACLTYLSVTVSIRNGGMPPFLFATNRILSTVIGVLVALFVNTFPHYFIKNRNILFISSLDNAMLNSKHELSPFMEYKLNALTGERCNFTFMTTRALTSLRNIFRNVKLQKPIIVMTGCAVYDPVEESYSSVVCIDRSLRECPEALFESYGVNVFSYLISENTLHCYYDSVESKGAAEYYSRRRKSSSYTFVRAKVPKDMDIAQYVIIEKDEIVQGITADFAKLDCAELFNVISYPFQGVEGYSFLKINYKDALKENALGALGCGDYDCLICFGSGRTDVGAMKKADFSFCLSSAPDYVKQAADYVIPSDEPDEIGKLIAKIFHTKNYKKFLSSLRESAAAEQ